ncbi:MAG: hypothetical protein GXP31_07980 [Kiritimatiellaeota bacterium]|nr:hypothetical protein [Kiritimatiellota bacterium]
MQMNPAVRLAAMLFSAFFWVATGTAGPVTARDSGVRKVHNGWIAGHKDHTWQDQQITLSSDAISYGIKYRACVDPSHPGVWVCDEGFIGMPRPNVANWYHTGFYHIEIGGKQLGSHPLTAMGITESGERGAFHMVWDTPEYVARLQFLLPPGSDHLLTRLSWRPKPGRTVGPVKVRFTCYPSFFTTAHNRQGDRTLTTPRTTVHEVTTEELAPAEDTYLLYTDGVFDVAKGEGSGPCAMLFLPEQIASGRVQLGGYAVQTKLEAGPDAHELRFAFWDLTGKTNAEAQALMKASADQAREELRAAVFSPLSLARFSPEAATAEIGELLAAARDDGTRLRPGMEKLLRTLSGLKARAGQGDWQADAEFAKQVREYEALVWKLKIFALLNRP